MKYTRHRRILSLLLLLCISLSACASPAKEPNEIPSTAGVSTTATVPLEIEEKLYTQYIYPFPGGCTVKAAARIDNTVLIQGSDHGVPILSLATYIMDEAGQPSFGDTFMSVALDAPDSVAEAAVYGITAGADGFFYVLAGELPRNYSLGGQSYSNPDYQGRLTLLRYSVVGELEGKLSFDSWPSDDITGILVNKAGTLIIYGGNYVASFPWSEKPEVQVSYIDAEDFFVSGSLCGDMAVFTAFTPEAGKYYRYDYTTAQLSELIISTSKGPLTVDFCNTAICQGLNGEFIIDSNSRFFSWIPDENCKELFRWNYDYYVEQYPYICRLSEKSFACVKQKAEYLIIVGLREEPKLETSTVHVALLGDNLTQTNLKLQQMNANGSKYRYEIKEYSEIDKDKLLSEITAGNAPDLIAFNIGLNTNSKYYEDLYSYIDNDSALSRDSFIPNLLESLDFNGKLHEIWETAYLNMMAIRGSDYRENASIDDYNALVAERPEYAAVFQNYMSKQNLLRWVSVLGTSMFTDKETATCDFNNELFKKMLSWCTQMPDEQSGEFIVAGPDISEVLLSVECISDLLSMQALQNNFGTDYHFVGFPVSSTGESYYSKGRHVSYAIPVASSNKDGAWNFIREQLVMNNQLDIEYGLPVNIDAMKRKAEKILTEDEQNKLFALLMATRFSENYSDESINEIITNCGQAYLAGDKSLEDAIALIQSQVSIYMSEQYG